MFIILFCSVPVAHAQVTIGSNATPDENALLDLKQDGVTKAGLLMPRVALVQTILASPMTGHVKGMTVYNTATINDVVPGFYYNNGTKWLKTFSVEDSFFYMPATVLPTDQSDSLYNTTSAQFEIDLYGAYKKQFARTATNVAVSDAAVKLPVYNSGDLYYIVSYYDDTVFTNVKISTAGLLTYKLVNGFTYSEKTFMNIILKVK